MLEITKIPLENEMDLILANRRAMKLAELAGFSVSGQTTFATAVSEISRSAIEYGSNASVSLNIGSLRSRYKELIATISDTAVNFLKKNPESIAYARKLVGYLDIKETDKSVDILVNFRIPAGEKVNQAVVEQWKTYFVNEPAATPYDEIKRKNLQLQEMAEKLRESENKYKLLAESLPLIIFSMNKEGDLGYVNKWFFEFSGTSAESIGANLLEHIAYPEDYELIKEDLKKHISTSQPFRDEWRLKHKETGEYLWHLISVMPITDNQNNIINWIGFLVDINAQKLIQQTIKDNIELKEVQRQLKEYQVKLEAKITELNRSNYELEQFAYVASHDLQEPLRKIILYTDLIKNKYAGRLPAQDNGLLEHLIESAARMKSLIEDLLTYSSVQNEGVAFEKTDLNKIAANVLIDLDLAIRESNARITIAPLPVLEANPLNMYQLFYNLIGNSIKYTRKNVPPEISVESHEEGDKVELVFSDKGIGFDQKYQDKVFGLFQRLHTRHEYSGTGIGLAICKKITEIHNGNITAEGSVNSGARFIVSLPLTHKKQTS